MVDKAFRHLLEEKRDAIAAHWRDLVLATYPPEVARFMSSTKDPFANPVGETFARCLGPVLDHLIDPESKADVDVLVTDMMRVRAVQQFMPSTAVGFFFVLKKVIRDEVSLSTLEPALLREAMAFEARVDQIALRAFDAYLGCREKLYEIRATELRRRSERVITKLNERLLARHEKDAGEEAESSNHNSERGGTR